MTSTSRPVATAVEFADPKPPAPAIETYVPDHRAGVRPSDHVQSKLLTMTRSIAVPVSCLHSRRDARR